MEYLTKQVLQKMYEHAAQYIGTVVEAKEDSKDFPTLIGIGYIHNSFINNLKAALTHFKRMGDSLKGMDDSQIGEDALGAYKQFELIGEHIMTGVVDYHVDMMQHFARYYALVIKCIEAERYWKFRVGGHKEYIGNDNILLAESLRRQDSCLDFAYEIRTKIPPMGNTLDWKVTDISESLLGRLGEYVYKVAEDWHSFQDVMQECIASKDYLADLHRALRSATRNNGHIHRVGNNHSIINTIEKLKYKVGYITIETFMSLNPQHGDTYYKYGNNEAGKKKKDAYVEEGLDGYFWYAIPGEKKVVPEPELLQDSSSK